MNQSIENLIADFELLDEWEERYRHVIELGRDLPDMDVALKTTVTKVSGCASQVWIFTKIIGAGAARTLELHGDSDALIVKGLIAIAFLIFAPLTLTEIENCDASVIFKKLGLQEHLTPQRSNGLASMVARIKSDARAALA